METEVKKFTCSVCGAESSHEIITKVDVDGVGDMDLRPVGKHRESMEYWVMECPECSYCNGDITIPFKSGKKYLESNEYKSLGGIETDNILVSRFIRKALVCIKNRDYAEAVTSYLYGAWVFDDEGNTEKATQCRNESLSIIENSNLGDDINIMLLRADLLRRTGQFDKLIDEYGGKSFEEPFILLASQYEVRLAREKDDSVHSMKDIPGVEFT